MKAKVTVMPKKSVLDPQGVAVRDAVALHGFSEVATVRIGKLIELEIEGSPANARERLKEICSDLLSNPVIEDYTLEIED